MHKIIRVLSSKNTSFSSALLFLTRITCWAGALLVLAGVASGQQSASVEPPAISTAVSKPGVVRALTPDEVIVLDYYQKASSLVDARKFDELDAMADSARSGRERFPGGGWKLNKFYQAMASPHRDDPADAIWEDHILRLKEWVTQKPLSVTARISLADAYLNYASKARGGETADQVTEEGWRLFHERTALAKGVLQEAAAMPKCPHWYYLMVLVAKAEGWEIAKTRALVDQAFEFDPSYYYTYQAYVDYLLPKWAGEEGDSERFIAEIAKRAGGKQGDMLYFELARDLDCSMCGNGSHLRNMNWYKIKRGYAATEERYGVSNLKMNAMAYAAVQLYDATLAEELFARIGENWDQDVWKKKEHFDEFKKWPVETNVFKYAPKISTGPMPEELEAIAAVANDDTDSDEGGEYTGTSYLKFVRGNAKLYQECIAAAGENSGGSFDLYLQIGKAGNVIDAKPWPQTRVSGCILPAVTAFTFGVPPHPPYWVKMIIDLPKHPSGGGAAKASLSQKQ